MYILSCNRSQRCARPSSPLAKASRRQNGRRHGTALLRPRRFTEAERCSTWERVQVNGMPRKEQEAPEATGSGAAPRPQTALSHFDAAIARVDEQFGSLPYMTTRQARYLGALVEREGLTSLLELGTYHGKSTAYIAAILEALGRGSLITIDRIDAAAKQPNVYHLLSSLGLSHRVRVYLEQRSLTWRLMRLIEENHNHCFDFCYFDAGHSWDVTGFAFFLVDRLLKPGGWVIFDDLDWTYDRMIKPDEPVPDFLAHMPEEERRTAQIGKVWELLVCRSTGYETLEVIGSWGVARKRTS